MVTGDRNQQHLKYSFLVLVLVGALAGCAPLASFRPASGLMPGRSLEVGAGAAMITPRPYVSEPARGAGQVWVSGEPTSWLSLSGITVFDTDAAGAGGAVRINYLRTPGFVAGVEGEAGFAWVGASLPLSARLFDQTWLYGGPRIANWGVDPVGGATAGLSTRITGGFILRAEAQVSWQGFKYYNFRKHFGLAAAYQFR